MHTILDLTASSPWTASQCLLSIFPTLSLIQTSMLLPQRLRPNSQNPSLLLTTSRFRVINRKSQSKQLPIISETEHRNHIIPRKRYRSFNIGLYSKPSKQKTEKRSESALKHLQTSDLIHEPTPFSFLILGPENRRTEAKIEQMS